MADEELHLDRLKEGLCPRHGTPLERRDDNGWCEQCGTGWSLRGDPSIDPGRGSGSPRRWSTADARLVKVLGELNRLGADTRTLRLVPELLAHHCGEGWLLVGPGRVRLCTIEELVDALTHDEPSWHVVRLSTVLHGLPTDDAAAA